MLGSVIDIQVLTDALPRFIQRGHVGLIDKLQHRDPLPVPTVLVTEPALLLFRVPASDFLQAFRPGYGTVPAVGDVGLAVWTLERAEPPLQRTLAPRCIGCRIDQVDSQFAGYPQPTRVLAGNQVGLAPKHRSPLRTERPTQAIALGLAHPRQQSAGIVAPIVNPHNLRNRPVSKRHTE